MTGSVSHLSCVLRHVSGTAASLIALGQDEGPKRQQVVGAVEDKGAAWLSLRFPCPLPATFRSRKRQPHLNSYAEEMGWGTQGWVQGLRGREEREVPARGGS